MPFMNSFWIGPSLPTGGNMPPPYHGGRLLMSGPLRWVARFVPRIVVGRRRAFRFSRG